MKKILAFVLAAVMVLAFAACGSTADYSAQLDEIKSSGTINIGVFSDKSPFGYVDENGEYQGYDVYFANRIGEDLGVTVNYVSTEAANRVEYLETGKVDIILANFTVTDERAETGMLLPDENRLSSFGRKLRATSLDELPELINILKGDMSVVG